jgi:hypothetical protein
MRSGANLGKEIERRIRARNFPGVKSLYAELQPAQRQWRNENGESFLHIAMNCHQPEIFEWFYKQLEHNFIVFSLDNENRSLVWLATKKKKTELAQRLLLNQLTSDRFTTEKLNKHNREEILDLRGFVNSFGASLLGKRISTEDWLKQDRILQSSVLHLAAQMPSSELLEFYIAILEEKNRLRELINQENKNKKTPLLEACSEKAFDCMVVLINHGADLYLLDKDQNNFFTWLEKADSATDDQKVDFFRRLEKQKQLDVLSYGRRYFQDDEKLKALYDKLSAARLALCPDSDVGADLNKFDLEKIKDKSQVLDEDRRITSKLIKRIDDYLAILHAKPRPPASRHLLLFRAFARISKILGVSSILYFCIYLLGIIAAGPTAVLGVPFVLTTVATIATLTAISPGVLMAIAAVLFLSILILATIGFFKLAIWLDTKATAPVVNVNKAEFATLIDDIDTTFIQKCNSLKERKGVAALPVPSMDFLSLEIPFVSLKGATTTSSVNFVETQFGFLKKRLENFQKDMIANNKPFSEFQEAAPIVSNALPMRIEHAVAAPQLPPQAAPPPPPPAPSLQAPRRHRIRRLQRNLEAPAIIEQAQTLPAEQLVIEKQVITDIPHSITVNIAGHWASLHAIEPELESESESEVESAPVPTSTGMDADIGDDDMLAIYAFNTRRQQH